jgi:hypothetical protein
MPQRVRAWYDTIVDSLEEGFTIIGAYEFASPFASAMIAWRAALRAAEICAENDHRRGGVRD